MAQIKLVILCCAIGLGATAQAVQFTISLGNESYEVDFTASKAEFRSHLKKATLLRKACNAAYVDSISLPFFRLYTSEKEADANALKDSIVVIADGDKKEKR